MSAQSSQPKSKVSIPIFLKHFVGYSLSVELKTGRILTGTLDSADQHKVDGTVVGSWGMKVWGRNKEKSANRQNAHISRQELRRILMSQVDPSHIHWGYKLRYHKEEGDILRMKFERNDGQTFETEADILVGADGIRSTVRSNKIGDNASPLRYLGCIVILGITATPVSTLLDGETGK